MNEKPKHDGFNFFTTPDPFAGVDSSEFLKGLGFTGESDSVEKVKENLNNIINTPGSLVVEKE